MKFIVWLIAGLLISNLSFGQSTKYMVEGDSHLVLSGTSNIHDWEMEANVKNCSIILGKSENPNVMEIKEVNFQLPVVDLKSEHKKMDDNAYKALNASKAPVIQFKAYPDQKIALQNGEMKGNLKGMLEIAGTQKEVNLELKGKVENLSEMAFQFKVPIVMEDYKVEPPVLMFGAISTGSKVLITFDLFFKESNQISSK